MEGNPDWPALLTDYQTALEEFDRVTEGLAAALVDVHSAAELFPPLFAAESKAHDAVILSRIRLMKAWRDSQPGFR